MLAKLKFSLRRFFVDQQWQDLIEYALMVGFVVVAAGAIMPGVADSISKIFSKVAATMEAAATNQDMAGGCIKGYAVDKATGKCVAIPATERGK